MGNLWNFPFELPFFSTLSKKRFIIDLLLHFLAVTEDLEAQSTRLAN